MTTTTSPRKQTTIIPDVPRNVPLVNESKMLTEDWKFFFDQLTAALQINLKPEGYVIPAQSATSIVQLTGETSKNNIVYDSTNHAFYGNILNIFDSTTTPITYTQKWVQLATIIDGSGDPNGVVAGNLNQFYLDTVGLLVYICTTTGNANGLPAGNTQAIWTMVCGCTSDGFLLL